jgi:putative ABC transport system permease protein
VIESGALLSMARFDSAADTALSGLGHARQAGAGRPPTAAAAQHAVQAALRAQPGTLRYVAQADQPVTVAGLPQPVAVTAFRGDASWTGYDMISGRWYAGPGQVDVASRFLTVTGTTIGDTVTLTLNGRQIPVRIVGQVFATDNSGLAMVTGWQTLAGADPGLVPDRYDVAVRPGTDLTAYVLALRGRLGPDYLAQVNNRPSEDAYLMISLIGALTVPLAVVAGLGVLNTVVLHTRERVHDLGVFKAVGMTPRQTIAMVVCWVAGTGLAAGVIAVPAGITLHRLVLPAMAAAADVGLPASVLNVYHGQELAAPALAGIAIAAAGALLPASWAASIRTATALRTEYHARWPQPHPHRARLRPAAPSYPSATSRQNWFIGVLPRLRSGQIPAVPDSAIGNCETRHTSHGA